jgi:hypothetical protein
MNTVESLVPELSCFEVEIAKNLKRYKSLGIDQTVVELVQAGGNTLRYETHKIINSILYGGLLLQWKESTSVPTHEKGDKAD